MFHINPGETWTGREDRDAKLVTCVIANVDVPTIFKAEDYQSTGTSYAAFEIVFDADDTVFDYVVQRPGGNPSGPHIESCAAKARKHTSLCSRTLDPITCGDYPFEKYHSVWPPICDKPNFGTKVLCVCPAAPFCNERLYDPYTCDKEGSPCPPTAEPTVKPTEAPQTAKPTEQPTNPGTAGCPSGSNTPQPWNECKQWYMCSNGQASDVQDCPSGLLFNSDSGYVMSYIVCRLRCSLVCVVVSLLFFTLFSFRRLDSTHTRTHIPFLFYRSYLLFSLSHSRPNLYISL